jgi:PTS system nitrogen regulatory IIA component
MILTLRELAQMLRVNERTILRMLKSGQLKGAKIGGQWRFNSSQIDGLFFPGEDAAGTDGEDVSLEMLSRSQIGIPISRLMSESRAVMSLSAGDVSAAIDELTSPRLLGSVVLDAKDLRAKCLAREKLLSTGVGNGVAIPHPRDPVTTLRAPAIVVFGRAERGIDFGAADGKPVHLFFLICSQSIELHLHLMGRMAHLLRHQGFVAQCNQAATPQDAIRLVMEAERTDFLAQG